MQIGQALNLRVGTAVTVPYNGKRYPARVTASTRPQQHTRLGANPVAWVTATIQLTCSCTVTVTVKHTQVR